VVLDCGNGSAGVFAPRLLKTLGCDVVELYTTPDSSFPNHIPDPEDQDHMKDLMAAVVRERADIGIGLDADGDRCGVVTETGELVYADRVLLALAKDILSRHPGKKVLYDVKCSRILEDFIPKFGGVPLMHKTGHAPIKQTLRDDPEIILGGEVSGHFYFVEDYFKIDDGLFAAVKLLSLLSASVLPLSEFFSEFPKTVMTPEIKLPCDDGIKHTIVQSMSDMFSQNHKTILLDGVRILFSPTSWGLVRASNTSPYLTIRVEADTEQEVLVIKNKLADELEKYPEITDKLDREHVTSRTGRLGWV
jgi:phosphomannomutase/phosphoglucomutase